MSIFQTRWKIARSIWPYPEGWGTYRTNWITDTKTILDTGLTKGQAIDACKELNGKK